MATQPKLTRVKQAKLFMHRNKDGRTDPWMVSVKRQNGVRRFVLVSIRNGGMHPHMAQLGKGKAGQVR